MGLQSSELYALELREFFAAYQGWLKYEELKQRASWEIARWVAGVAILPHVTSSMPLTQMLPLPWDAPSTEPMQELDYDPNNLAERRAHIERVLGYKFEDNE